MPIRLASSVVNTATNLKVKPRLNPEKWQGEAGNPEEYGMKKEGPNHGCASAT
jgi:hypothetical protein